MHFVPQPFKCRFLDLVRSVVSDIEIDPTLLRFEITETAAITNIQTTSTVLSALQDIGVGISLDDFGTGFSSLSHLQTLPFNELKIDRSFVMTQAAQQSNWSIATAILQMAKAMNIHAVAEGIETEFQLNALINLGCLYGQGFHLGYPCDEHQILNMIENARQFFVHKA